MRGLYLILGYVLGNETARKWCFENLKKASVIIDNELKKMPIGKKIYSIIPDKTMEQKDDDSSRPDRQTDFQDL